MRAQTFKMPPQASEGRLAGLVRYVGQAEVALIPYVGGGVRANAVRHALVQKDDVAGLDVALLTGHLQPWAVATPRVFLCLSGTVLLAAHPRLRHSLVHLKVSPRKAAQVAAVINGLRGQRHTQEQIEWRLVVLLYAVDVTRIISSGRLVRLRRITWEAKRDLCSTRHSQLPRPKELLCYIECRAAVKQREYRLTGLELASKFGLAILALRPRSIVPPKLGIDFAQRSINELHWHNIGHVQPPIAHESIFLIARQIP